MTARNIAVLIVLLVRVSDLHAQSAKKINEQLKRELEIQWLRNDSLLNVYNQQKSVFITARSSAMNALYGTLKAANFNVEETRYNCGQIKYKLEVLAVKLDGVEAEPISSTGYYGVLADMKTTINYEPKKFVSTDGPIPFPRKLKGQNMVLKEMLSWRVSRSDSLEQELTLIDQYTKSLKAFNKVSDSYFTNYLELSGKWTTHYTAHNEKLIAVKTEYVQKGPKGYDVIYRRVFNDVFQDKDIRQWKASVNDEPTMIDDTRIDDASTGVAPEIYEAPEITAEFPGGKEKLKEYLSSSIIYPDFALSKKIGGKCSVKFVVSETGKITHAKVVSGIRDCKECDEEALRVVLSMPNWIPATRNGKPVKTYCNLPINFIP